MTIEDAAFYVSAVWLGWALNAYWKAFKRRIRFRLNIGEFIAEDPDVLRAMIQSLRIENARLHKKIKRQAAEVTRLRQNILSGVKNERDA